jgi:hypothetical protein
MVSHKMGLVNMSARRLSISSVPVLTELKIIVKDTLIDFPMQSKG